MSWNCHLRWRAPRTRCLQALRETEPFRTCARLRESVMEDEVSRRLLERFTRAEAALRMAAAAGVEPKPEERAGI